MECGCRCSETGCPPAQDASHHFSDDAIFFSFGDPDLNLHVPLGQPKIQWDNITCISTAAGFLPSTLGAKCWSLWIFENLWGTLGNPRKSWNCPWTLSIPRPPNTKKWTLETRPLRNQANSWTNRHHGMNRSLLRASRLAHLRGCRFCCQPNGGETCAKAKAPLPQHARVAGRVCLTGA